MGLRDPFKRTSDLCLDGRITRSSSHPVAAGGYADVWEGHFATRKVAIKVMRPFASSGKHIQESKLLRRLWREYLAWSCLSHPNILECLGFSYDFSPDSYLFPSLISPWVANGTVISYLERYPDKDRLRLLVGVAEGLSYLHSRTPSIVHGDLRAGNILVSEFGVPYLSDFGLSRVLSEAKGLITSTDLAGSLRWMSPELFHVDRGVTVHSDVWAFGMTVLEILSGERPYFNVKSDIFVLGQVRDGLLPQRPQDPRTLKRLSDDMWAICQRCWSLQPTERPSMHDVVSMFLFPGAENSPTNPHIVLSNFASHLQFNSLADYRALLLDIEDEELVKQTPAAVMHWQEGIAGIHDPEWKKFLELLGMSSDPTSASADPLVSIMPRLPPSVFPSPSPSLFPSTPSSTAAPTTPTASAGDESQAQSGALSSEFRKDGSDWFARISNVSDRMLAIDINLVHTLEHESVVCSVRYSPDGKYLATGCNHTTQIYDTRTGAKMCVLKDETAATSGVSYIRTVCFSPDGKSLAAGGDDKQIRIWNIEKRRIRTIFEGHRNVISSLEFSRDGRLLVSGSGDRTGRIWDMETGKYVELLIDEPSEIEACVISTAISPDGLHVATGSVDKVIRLWDVETGALIDRLVGHETGVFSVAFTPDGRGLVSGSIDQTLKHWDLGPLLRHPMRDAWLSQPYKASHPEKQSEKGCECTVTFTGHDDPVLSVAISRDSRWVVSGSRDGCVQFWDLRTAHSQLMLQGHKRPVKSLDLSPAGRMLATASGDRRVRIWKLEELDHIVQAGWKSCTT